MNYKRHYNLLISKAKKKEIWEGRGAGNPFINKLPELYDIWLDNKSPKEYRFSKIINNIYKVKHDMGSIIKYFTEKGNPMKDTKYIQFQKEINNG